MKNIESGPETKIRQRILWAVGVALAIRLIVVAFVYPGFLDPGRDHWEFGYEIGRVARSIATGHGFGNPYWMSTGATAELPPVYPYLLAGVFKIWGVDTKAAALVILGLNGLFSALTCIPIYLVARKITSERVAQVAMWMWAFYPYAVYFSVGTMWYHGLVALLVAWQVWMALRLASSTNIWEWCAFGALTGITVLTDPTTLSIVPFLIGWACYGLRGAGKRWAAPAAASLLITALAITPWLIRNYQVFHKPVFLRDGFWLEIYVGNVGNSLHWWNTDIHPAGSVAERQEYLQLGELGYMAHKKEQAIAYIEANPGTVAIRTFRRFIFLWTGFWSLNKTYLQEEPFDRINFFLCLSLTAIMLFSLRTLFRESPRESALLAILIAVFPLPYYLSHPDLEYRQPVEPFIVILISFGLAHVWERIASRDDLGYSPDESRAPVPAMVSTSMPPENLGN